MNLNLSESNILPKFNYRDLIIFILPILIFGLYAFVYRPGVLTAASYGQLHQISTGEFTTACPIFHTLLEMLCLSIFQKPVFISIFQILIFSTIWMVICKYHRDDSIIDNDELFLQFLITIIICLIPINAIYSITFSSNILFSYSILFLCFLIKVMIDKDGKIGTKLLILIASTLAIVSGLNNYGFYVAFISLAVITYYLLKKGLPQNKFITFVSLAILFLLLVGSLNFIYDVRGDKLDIQTNDAFEERIDLESARTEFFSAANEQPTHGFENELSWTKGSLSYDLIDSFVSLFRENFILDGLFNNPLLYLVLSIALLVLINLINKSQEIFLVYVPVISNVFVSLLTGQNNMYSNLLVFYFLIIIFVSILFKNNLKIKDISGMASGQNKPQPKVEANELYLDNNYADLEKAINELTPEDINEILHESEQSEKPVQTAQPQETPSSNLVDEILEEIEIEKK